MFDVFLHQLSKRQITAQAKQEELAPSGWLVSPKKDKVLYFIRDTKSRIIFPDVMTHLWSCTIEGLPKQFKNTRRMDFESAIETWTELMNNGWKLVKYMINDNPGR